MISRFAAASSCWAARRRKCRRRLSSGSRLANDRKCAAMSRKCATRNPAPSAIFAPCAGPERARTYSCRLLIGVTNAGKKKRRSSIVVSKRDRRFVYSHGRKRRECSVPPPEIGDEAVHELPAAVVAAIAEAQKPRGRHHDAPTRSPLQQLHRIIADAGLRGFAAA
jgi:hypothetical protein